MIHLWWLFSKERLEGIDSVDLQNGATEQRKRDKSDALLGIKGGKTVKKNISKICVFFESLTVALFFKDWRERKSEIIPNPEIQCGLFTQGAMAWSFCIIILSADLAPLNFRRNGFLIHWPRDLGCSEFTRFVSTVFTVHTRTHILPPFRRPCEIRTRDERSTVRNYATVLARTPCTPFMNWHVL